MSFSEGSYSIHLTAIKNEQGVVRSYYSTTWNGLDLAPVYTKYTIAEAQSKFVGLVTKTQFGTSVDPHRVILNYNDDGALISAEFHVTGAQFERVIVKNGAISNATKVDAVTAKADVETKTGKDVGGGPIKPPNVETPIETGPEPE